MISIRRAKMIATGVNNVSIWKMWDPDQPDKPKTVVDWTKMRYEKRRDKYLRE